MNWKMKIFREESMQSEMWISATAVYVATLLVKEAQVTDHKETI